MTTGEIWAVPAGTKARARQEEQDHLTVVHDRVDQLRQRAERQVAASQADQGGSTFQARFERDVVAHHHAARAARFRVGDVESVVFGRIDLADGERLHIGRLSVVDDSAEVLLVDWRAQAAAAFYQATAAEPSGVARRRTLTTRGRELVDLDDEILDAVAADALGLVPVTGQGALLAAISRDRSPVMHDIVATIQADQDRIIRAPANGTLVITGGPGTGKTVVALHRVAFLLYRDRARFEGRGVLVVGPSRAFTEYTSRVLPALGEERAVQRHIGAICAVDVETDGWDHPGVARIKGELSMVAVLARMVRAWMPVPSDDVRFSVEGTAAVLARQEIVERRDRVLARLDADGSGTSLRALRSQALASLRAAAWAAWRDARRAQGHPVDLAPDDHRFHAALDSTASYRMLRRSYWPIPPPQDVLGAFVEGRIAHDRVATAEMPAERLETLLEAWIDAGDWRVDDAPLLDELAMLIGLDEPDTVETVTTDPGLRAGISPTAAPRVADVTAGGYQDFAHVVVDEAQELSPMQWRSLARRGRFASWTVVGDLAQRSRPDAPGDWTQVTTLIGRRNVAVHELTVNYRTPTEIAAVAEEVLSSAGLDTPSSQSVRSTGLQPVWVTSTDVPSALTSLVSDLLASHEGTIGVIAPPDEVDALRDVVGLGDADGRTRVLEIREAKGLEFDDVVVVHPERLHASGPTGAHDLYVAFTRSTRTLTAITGPGARFPAHERFRATTGPLAAADAVSSRG